MQSEKYFCFLSRKLKNWKLLYFILTAAHVGLLHAPDVRSTLVTRLHDVDLVVDETVIQGALDLTGEFLIRHLNMHKKKENAVGQRQFSMLGTYTFIFWPPLLSCFSGLKNRHHVSLKLLWLSDTEMNYGECLTLAGSASSFFISPRMKPSSTDWKRLTTSCTSSFCLSLARWITLFW